MSCIQSIRESIVRNVGLRHKWEGFNLEQWLFNYLALIDDIDSEQIVIELGREYAESLFEQWQHYTFGFDEDENDHSLALFALCQLFLDELRQGN